MSFRKLTSLIFYFLLFNRITAAQLQPAHTVIVILENRSYTQIVGNPQAPYINTLLADIHTARLTQSFALIHPSQPNYLMLYAGDPQGVNNNFLPSSLPLTTPNLGASLLQSGKTFTGYSEDLPYAGYTGELSGGYARKHNPWVNWQASLTNGIPTSSNSPFSDFPSDYNLLPSVCIIVPNQNNDMHDGSIAAGDMWIQNHLDAYVQWCKVHNSLFILTFDEDDGSSNNHILTLLTGANINGGSFNQPVTHYNVLRTVETLYQLPYAGASNDSSAIQGIWLMSLPVHLIEFNGAALEKQVLLHWVTSEEYHSKEFIIERSSDNGQSWLKVGVMAAAVNHVLPVGYTYRDTFALSGKNFYRLKMVDNSGAFMYSNTISVMVKDKRWLVYPNPSNGKLYISEATDVSGPLMVSIWNTTGLEVMKTKITSSSTPVMLDLSGCPRGMYFITTNQNIPNRFPIILLTPR